MNILFRELKASRKPFLFWCLGLFVLLFAGIVKSTGFSGDAAGLSALLGAFPPPVLAVLGLSGVDMTTFPGFYAVLSQYALLLAAVYAVHLGNHAVSAEAVDKTYEFVFTKPRSRSYILTMKLKAGFVALLAFCVVQFLFSALATSTLALPESYIRLFFLYSLATWLVGFLFFSLGALFAALAPSAEKGARWSNFLILLFFCLGVARDMMPERALLRWLCPLRFFPSQELLTYHLDGWFVAFSLGLSILALLVAYRRFERKDLRAV